MTKKIRWVYLLKKLILCVSKPKTEKRSNGCRWIFQRFNLRQLPANSTPERTLLEVSEEQRKHALKVARATAAAAEAAVAAAQAAAELGCKREQQRNDSMFSEEEVESMSIRKLEAISRRNRMKQYSFSHRERHYGQTLEEALAYRNQWAEENVYRKERPQNTVQIIHSNPRIHDIDANLKLQSNSSPKGKSAEDLSSPFSHPRRSISHTGQKSSIDDSLSTSSSSFPSYMAATESAKAKMRSISTPRQRKGSFDTCFRHDPCCQSMRCSWSYFNHVSSSIT
ncbi:hypothetical protein Nepgr_020537 [Nepenthes gracilis]|uniref:DUF4005 domain-containing protein n=1 Tax=Nepenthes gracilis TaxID=150966 RepID=A0AAD3SYZ4_NEPGR|nr:hypothetical protein Nepgr_020537 [Nepenthes gracilis]